MKASFIGVNKTMNKNVKQYSFKKIEYKSVKFTSPKVELITSIPSSDTTGNPKIKVDRNRLRWELTWRIEDAYKDMGWNHVSAGKKAGISAIEFFNILKYKSPFSNEKLLRIANAIEREKTIHTFINDVQSNLDFLYGYSELVGDCDAFGIHEESILELISDDWLPPTENITSATLKEDGSLVIAASTDSVLFDILCEEKRCRNAITPHTLTELRIFNLAVSMNAILEKKNIHLVDSIFNDKNYCRDVLLVAYELNLIPSDEKIEAEQKAKNNSNTMDKIVGGFKLRQDMQDKDALICWIQSENIVIQKIQELEAHPNFPLKINYNIDTLKKWYKEAMPDVKLAAGRPKKQ